MNKQELKTYIADEVANVLKESDMFSYSYFPKTDMTQHQKKEQKPIKKDVTSVAKIEEYESRKDVLNNIVKILRDMLKINLIRENDLLSYSIDELANNIKKL